MTLRDSTNATSSPELEHGVLQPDLLDGETLTGSGQRRVRASRSAQQEKATEPMTQGTYGQTYFGSSVPPATQDSDLLYSWESRLRERLAMLGSTEYALIWREKVSPQGLLISRLSRSTRHMNGTDNTGRLLAVGVTASARDWKDTSGMASTELALWRGPTAGVNRGGAYSDPKKAIARISSGHTINLEDQMVASGTITGSSATMVKRGVPNPAFAFWLMGWPEEFQRGVLSVTASLSRQRSKSSRRSAK